MSKEWFCTICHRFGEFGSTLEDAESQHAQAQIKDARDNKWMHSQYPGFTGPRTDCPGKFVFRVVTTKAKLPRIESGILGGDEPWI